MKCRFIISSAALTFIFLSFIYLENSIATEFGVLPDAVLKEIPLLKQFCLFFNASRPNDLILNALKSSTSICSKKIQDPEGFRNKCGDFSIIELGALLERLKVCKQRNMIYSDESLDDCAIIIGISPEILNKYQSSECSNANQESLASFLRNLTVCEMGDELGKQFDFFSSGAELSDTIRERAVLLNFRAEHPFSYGILVDVKGDGTIDFRYKKTVKSTRPAVSLFPFGCSNENLPQNPKKSSPVPLAGPKPATSRKGG